MRDESTADNGIVYEVSYLLLPSLAIGEVPAKVASLRDTITKAGGNKVSQLFNISRILYLTILLIFLML